MWPSVVEKRACLGGCLLIPKLVVVNAITRKGRNLLADLTSVQKSQTITISSISSKTGLMAVMTMLSMVHSPFPIVDWQVPLRDLEVSRDAQ